MSHSKITKKEWMGKTGLSCGASNWVKNNVKQLEDLPAPQFEWTRSDVGLNTSPGQLQDIGVVEKVGSKKSEKTETRKLINVYRTTDVGYQAIRTHLEDLEEHGFSPCPCGHRGVSNLGDGEYGCLNDDCGEVYTRDEVDV